MLFVLKFEQNIHLVKKWLPTLERLLERFGNNAHAEYRVFLSVQPPTTKASNVVPQVWDISRQKCRCK